MKRLDYFIAAALTIVAVLLVILATVREAGAAPEYRPYDHTCGNCACDCDADRIRCSAFWAVRETNPAAMADMQIMLQADPNLHDGFVFDVVLEQCDDIPGEISPAKTMAAEIYCAQWSDDLVTVNAAVFSFQIDVSHCEKYGIALHRENGTIDLGPAYDVNHRTCAVAAPSQPYAWGCHPWWDYYHDRATDRWTEWHGHLGVELLCVPPQRPQRPIRGKADPCLPTDRPDTLHCVDENGQEYFDLMWGGAVSDRL